ncbi:hypothetical protein HAX54_024073, partial [Datura stramonium]|nr:hypothetical protein [Datura stramonium]
VEENKVIVARDLRNAGAQAQITVPMQERSRKMGVKRGNMLFTGEIPVAIRELPVATRKPPVKRILQNIEMDKSGGHLRLDRQDTALVSHNSAQLSAQACGSAVSHKSPPAFRSSIAGTAGI